MLACVCVRERGRAVWRDVGRVDLALYGDVGGHINTPVLTAVNLRGAGSETGTAGSRGLTPLPSPQHANSPTTTCKKGGRQRLLWRQEAGGWCTTTEGLGQWESRLLTFLFSILHAHGSRGGSTPLLSAPAVGPSDGRWMESQGLALARLNEKGISQERMVCSRKEGGEQDVWVTLFKLARQMRDVNF